MNLSGLITPTATVHGVTVRALNFSDISKSWQTKGAEIMAAFDAIVQQGESAKTGDVVSIVGDIIKFAPDLARDVFLAAINDDGQPHTVGVDANIEPLQMTATEVWDKHMSIGRQFEVLVAVFNLTVSESDSLKKIFKNVNPTTKAVTEALTIQQ